MNRSSGLNDAASLSVSIRLLGIGGPVSYADGHSCSTADRFYSARRPAKDFCRTVCTVSFVAIVILLGGRAVSAQRSRVATIELIVGT